MNYSLTIKGLFKMICSTFALSSSSWTYFIFYYYSTFDSYSHREALILSILSITVFMIVSLWVWFRSAAILSALIPLLDSSLVPSYAFFRSSDTYFLSLLFASLCFLIMFIAYSFLPLHSFMKSSYISTLWILWL